jgi:hypothetical protein
MTTIDHETLVAMLDRLKLTAIRDQLDSLLDEAARSKMTLREALAFFVQREIARRDERRISMASKIAQFPFAGKTVHRSANSTASSSTRSPPSTRARSANWRPADGSRMATRHCCWGPRAPASPTWP